MKVKKPKFSRLHLDLKGVFYMPRIIKSSKLGDAAILKQIIDIFKKEKIRTISSVFFNPELNVKKGVYTKIKPNKEDNKDICKTDTTPIIRYLEKVYKNKSVIPKSPVLSFLNYIIFIAVIYFFCPSFPIFPSG